MRAQLSQILKIQKTRQITTGFFFFLQLVTQKTTIRIFWRDCARNFRKYKKYKKLVKLQQFFLADDPRDNNPNAVLDSEN